MKTITLTDKQLSDVRAILIHTKLNMAKEAKELTGSDKQLVLDNIKDIEDSLQALK